VIHKTQIVDPAQPSGIIRLGDAISPAELGEIKAEWQKLGHLEYGTEITRSRIRLNRIKGRLGLKRRWLA
jgi:hypothetical protein